MNGISISCMSADIAIAQYCTNILAMNTKIKVCFIILVIYLTINSYLIERCDATKKILYGLALASIINAARSPHGYRGPYGGYYPPRYPHPIPVPIPMHFGYPGPDIKDDKVEVKESVKEPVKAKDDGIKFDLDYLPRTRTVLQPIIQPIHMPAPHPVVSCDHKCGHSHEHSHDHHNHDYHLDHKQVEVIHHHHEPGYHVMEPSRKVRKPCHKCKSCKTEPNINYKFATVKYENPKTDDHYEDVSALSPTDFATHQTYGDTHESIGDTYDTNSYDTNTDSYSHDSNGLGVY